MYLYVYLTITYILFSSCTCTCSSYLYIRTTITLLYMQFLYTQVFFIDHEHELTTFIDPRLPLPNQQFTYTPIQATVPARRTSYDNTGLRPHHTTTVRHSQSLDSDLAMGPATPTTPTTPQGASLAPPSSSSPPSQESSGRNELTVPGSSGGGGSDGASSARASIISESTAPPSELVYLPPLVLKARHLRVRVTCSALCVDEFF